MAVIKYRDKQGKLQLVNIPIYQVAVLPEGNQNLVGKILQYTGETTDNYTNGYFYKCESTSTEGLYAWTRVNVQPAGGGAGGTSNYEDLENLPKIGGVILKGDKTLVELGINNFDGDYNSLQNIPESFTPSNHTHLVKDITDLDLTGYIEKTQGTENVGKILKVNNVGELVLAEDETGSSVSVSAQGTSTDTIKYITIDDKEYAIGADGKSSLAELTDTNLTEPINGQILSYNSETSKWENTNAPTGTIIANPPGESSEDLTKIQVGDTIYGISNSLQINTGDEITNLAETIKSNNVAYGFKPTYKYAPIGLEEINKIKYIRATFWASAESNGIEVGEIRFSTTADDSGENFAFTDASVECSVTCYNDAPASNIITNRGRMGCNSTNPIVTITLSDLYLLDFTKYSYIKIYRGQDYVSTSRKLAAFSIDYSLDGEHYYSLCPQTNCDVDNLVSYGLAYTFDGTTLLNYSYSSELYSKIVLYDNTTSGLKAENVQKAIDELAENSFSIVPNPTDDIVADLTKIKINNTTYRIADDSIGKKVWYRFTTQSTGGNDASLNVTCDGTTKNYLYSTIRSNPLIVDGVFKLNYGLNGNQWRVTCLGDKVYYNNNLMENNSIIKEWSYGESVNFEIYNFTGTINEIIPNPEGEGAENLTKISINGTVYNVTGGGSSSSIIPNPEKTATQKLSKIEIDGVNYYFSTDGTPSAIDKYSNKIFISTTYGDKFECNGRSFIRTSEKEVISFFLKELGSDNKNYYGYCLLAKNEEDLAGTNNSYGDLVITPMTGTNGKTIYKGRQSGPWGENFNPSLNITSNSVTTNFSKDNTIDNLTQLQEDSEFFNACVEYLYKEVYIGNADNIKYDSSVSNLGVGNVQEAIDKLTEKDNIIVPNPETQSTEDLTKITINEVTYNIKGGEGGGSTITPNPGDISTEAVELTSLRIDNNDYKISSGGGSSNFLILSGVLSAGSTTITLSNESITGEEMIEIFTDIYGVNPKSVTSEVGSITLTFKAQESDMNIKVRCL